MLDEYFYHAYNYLKSGAKVFGGPPIPDVPTNQMILLDEALDALEQLNPREARVVELRYFAGLSLEETADAMGISVAKVRRDWGVAKAWLFRELTKRRIDR